MKDFKSRDASRYIISIDVAEPEVYGDIEWISVKIHGQSFMLHQIVSYAAILRSDPLLTSCLSEK